jgi:pyruvate dehydrogenase E2 component (dihydrolipoamide acetyltransferase)
VTLTAVVDAGQLVALKQRLQAGAGDPAAVRPTISDLLVMAAARTLSEQPALNASLLDDRHVIYEDVNIGLATDTERGLLVPTIYGADRKTLAEITRARKEVLGRIQASRQTADDLANGTFTISNLGMFGIRHFTAIINPPQGAILGLGIYRRRQRVSESAGDAGVARGGPPHPRRRGCRTIPGPAARASSGPGLDGGRLSRKVLDVQAVH